MTTLDEVTFNGPIALHGRLVREIVRDRPVPRTDGTLGPAWELHLHAEWQCVVAADDGLTALVPLQHVRSMTVHGRVQGAAYPDWVMDAPSRPRRTKRLGVVPE